MSVSEEIKRLHELHQAGALSDAEFEAAKARLLSGGSSPAPSAESGELNRLRRSMTDRWLGGVCGGLGKVTGIESWVWRLIFVLAVVCLGTGVLVYLLMWIFIPEE